MEPLTSTTLALPSATIMTEAFIQPIEAILKRIEDEARGYVPDLTTVAGRKAIASLAYRVAQSKTALDEAGK